MAALPQPKYGLNQLYLYPVYQTRAEYQAATGQEPPPFDPTRPSQHWFDPEAAKSSKRVIVYERALAIDENESRKGFLQLSISPTRKPPTSLPADCPTCRFRAASSMKMKNSTSILAESSLCATGTSPARPW